MFHREPSSKCLLKINISSGNTIYLSVAAQPFRCIGVEEFCGCFLVKLVGPAIMNFILNREREREIPHYILHLTICFLFDHLFVAILFVCFLDWMKGPWRNNEFPGMLLFRFC